MSSPYLVEGAGHFLALFVVLHRTDGEGECPQNDANDLEATHGVNWYK